MDLFAQYGEDRVSLRAVAAEAGVTLGLVQHHYKTKEGLREAVDQLVVDHFADAIADVPTDGTPSRVAADRDAAVRAMLAANPVVVNYLRRTVLEPDASRVQAGHLLEVLVDLTRRELTKLRSAGAASTQVPESVQVARILLQQFGELFLQPMIDSIWQHLDASPDDKPSLTVTVNSASQATGARKKARR